MAETVGSRGPYAKTARVRAHIVETAMQVFAEAGFRAGTMKEIAARAGISHRGLAHHFPSKEALLMHVLDERAAQSTRLMTLGDPAERLNSVLAVAEDNARRPGLVELHSLLAAEAVSPEHPAHRFHAERLAAWRAFLTETFQELQASDRLAGDVDPASTAAKLVALQDGLQLQWLYDREAVDVQAGLIEFLQTVVPTFTPSPASLQSSADSSATLSA